MLPQARRTLFLELSSALTGIAVTSFHQAPNGVIDSPAKPGDLMPRNTPIDLVTPYLATLDQEVGAAVMDAILQRLDDQKGGAGGPAKAAGNLLSDPVYGPICRSIMKMWFLGVWYAPADPRTPVRVISSQAYKEGLVWKVMQAHPMGYSTLSFGYWAEPPPGLDRFVTVVP